MLFHAVALKRLSCKSDPGITDGATGYFTVKIEPSGKNGMYQGKSVDAYGRSSIFIVKWLVVPLVRGGRPLDHFYKTIITWHS